MLVFPIILLECLVGIFPYVSAQSTTELSVADQYPLWNYDWSAVKGETQWLFLSNPRQWQWIEFSCVKGCCDAVCDNRDPSTFEYCIANVDQTCRLEATARVPIQEEDFLCLIRNPAYGDYGYDGSYYGFQLEWDVSWLPKGSDPYWLQWDGVQNDCADGSVYLRNADVTQGTCKAEMTWGTRTQTVNATSIGVYYEGQMANAYGATRAMFMIACRTIEVDWTTAKAYYDFKISSLGLRGIINVIERPTSTPSPLPSSETEEKTLPEPGPAESTLSVSTSVRVIAASDDSTHPQRLTCLMIIFLTLINA